MVSTEGLTTEAQSPSSAFGLHLLAAPPSQWPALWPALSALWREGDRLVWITPLPDAAGLSWPSPLKGVDGLTQPMYVYDVFADPGTAVTLPEAQEDRSTDPVPQCIHAGQLAGWVQQATRVLTWD